MNDIRIKLEILSLVLSRETTQKSGFVQDILDKHPYWYKKTEALLNSYDSLVAELADICTRINTMSHNHLLVKMPLISREFKEWSDKYDAYNVKEYCLVMDSYNLDIGNDHI
jgi:hypothetical protein